MNRITVSILSLGIMFTASQALAAGSSSSSSTTTTTTPPASPTQLKCAKGEVIKTIIKAGKKIKKCVKVVSGILPDNELFMQGRLLAKQGEYEWALTVLAAVQDKSNPDVLNYMGYSNRKAGRLDVAITYYEKALSINPNYVLAREYLGEGYVAAGKLELAKVQLNEIANRAGVKSEEYLDLSKAINGASI
jgi:tetratricopeptide (TPR) repeat protein